MPVSAARKAFPDLVNRAFYAGEVTIITRRGKGDVAAIIPISSDREFLHFLPQPTRKPSQSMAPSTRKSTAKSQA